MNRTKFAGILLATLFPLFSWAANGQLTITFANNTDGNVEFIPLINGETEFKTKNIVPTHKSLNGSILAKEITKQSVIYLKKNGEDIGRITLTPSRNNHDVRVTASSGTTPSEGVNPRPYQIIPHLMSSHPECATGEECQFWSQHPAADNSVLIVNIEPPK